MPPQSWQTRLRPAVLGAVDGLITTFAVLVAGSTTSVARGAILSVVTATMLADAVSMSVGEFLSSRPLVGVQEASLLAFVCGISFVCVGSVPILAYLIVSRQSSVWAAFVSALVLVGGARAALFDDPGATHLRRFGQLGEVLLLGVLASGVCYAAAYVTSSPDSCASTNTSL